MSIPVHDHFGHCPICDGDCRLFSRITERDRFNAGDEREKVQPLPPGTHPKDAAAFALSFEVETPDSLRQQIAGIVNNAMACARNLEDVPALDVADRIIALVAGGRRRERNSHAMHRWIAEYLKEHHARAYDEAMEAYVNSPQAKALMKSTLSGAS